MLESFGSGGPNTNPYLLQLARSLDQHVTVIPFSWGTALFGAFDVFHVHWPELLVRGRSRPKTIARHLLMSLLLARIRFRRIAVVRTVHNTVAHEPGHRKEDRLLARLDSLTDFVIQLSPAISSDIAAPSRVVLHGDYREWFAKYDVPVAEPGRVLYFGLIRRYKGVEQLVEAFTQLDDPDIRLRVAGRPDPQEVRTAIESLAARDQRVTARFGYLPDDELVDEIGRAELIVLPFTKMQNSGSAILALSLGRPILVSDGAPTRALRDEVGAEWVQTYEGVIDAAKLADGLAAARQARSAEAPDLSSRTWPEIGAQHAAVFTEAVALVEERGSRGPRVSSPTAVGGRR